MIDIILSEGRPRVKVHDVELCCHSHRLNLERTGIESTTIRLEMELRVNNHELELIGKAVIRAGTPREEERNIALSL